MFFNYIAFFSQDTSIEIGILKELRIVKKQIKNKRSVGFFGVIMDCIYKISNSIIIPFYSRHVRKIWYTGDDEKLYKL